MSMVDITSKEIVYREAVAEGVIRLREETIKMVLEGRIEKGDVFTTSRIAAINAVKNTWNILPLCHNIPITHVQVDYKVIDGERIKVIVKVKTAAKTGVEMEALTGAAVALLNIWDMVKKYEKDPQGQYPHTRIEYIRVVSKKKAEAGAPVSYSQ